MSRARGFSVLHAGPMQRRSAGRRPRSATGQVGGHSLCFVVCAKVFKVPVPHVPDFAGGSPCTGDRRVMMEEDSKNEADKSIARLRTLAHDLSNAIENVMQASYLLAQAEFDSQSKKWLALIDEAASEAARLNREIREILRSRS